VPNPLTSRGLPALVLAMLAAAPSAAQEPEKVEAPAGAPAPELKHPDPIPRAVLLPDLPTVPVRRGATTFNLQMVDVALLPRDKNGIWVLDFAFRPLRLMTVEVPGKGRRQVHYMTYRVVNHTGKPREFVPQLTLVTDTGKRYEEAVLPRAVPLIQGREDMSIRLLGPVDIAGVIPVSVKEGVDDAVYGVAIWDGVDPNADRMSIYVRGLSDGFQDAKAPDGKAVTRYKTLRIDLIRRGDARDLNEKEIQLADPSYEWVYW